MRDDAIGMFWQDIPHAGKAERRARVMPPIPETGWRPPGSYPNLSCARVLSVDVETYDPELEEHGPGWARGKGHIAGFSVGADNDGRWYFPIRHTVEPEMNMDSVHTLAWLRDAMSNPNQPKVGANLLYDFGWLAHEGVDLKGELVDVQFAEALLDERAKVALEILSQKYLGEGKTAEVLQTWILDYYGGSKDKWRANIYRSPPRLAGPYGEGDADLPLRLAVKMYPLLERENLLDVFRMECGLIPLLVKMRMAGVSVDLAKAEMVSDDLKRRAKEEHAKLDHLAKMKVEINAADSVAKAFDKFGLKYGRTAPTKAKPKGSPSFTKAFLATVEHPLVDHILEIRRLEKLRGTFIKGYILEGHVDGKLYCSFHPLRSDQGGARSGRFSSSDPNLQNIPIRDPELGTLIRSMFIPDAGHRGWLKYDYSQIEFRFLVHYAVGPGSDEARQRYIAEPSTDYHNMVQIMVQDLTKRAWDRRPIKNLNFGKVYGMGDAKAAASTGLKGKALEEFLKAYDAGIPFAKKTMQWAMDHAAQTGTITTILGRKSRFDLWEPAEWGTEEPALPLDLAIRAYGRIRRAYLHKALNRLLQGSAADMMKMAMYRCWKDGVFDRIGVPRLTVHDELDFSDPGGVDDGFVEMRRILENAIKLRIPVIADVESGPDWGNVTEIDT